MAKVYKDLNSTFYMPKRELKDTKIGLKDKPKAETVIVKGTVTKEQRELLQKLIGTIGSNEQDVVGKILTLWLYNEGFLKIRRAK
jgi:hypothetical protein